jgi:hypothetical protein
MGFLSLNNDAHPTRMLYPVSPLPAATQLSHGNAEGIYRLENPPSNSAREEFPP